MRIVVAEIADFCQELRRFAKLKSVWCNEVRFAVDSDPEQKEAISFRVGLWLTTLIDRNEGQCVLEYAAVCGSDEPRRKDATGTTEATRRIKEVAAICNDEGLVLCPGKIEAF